MFLHILHAQWLKKEQDNHTSYLHLSGEEESGNEEEDSTHHSYCHVDKEGEAHYRVYHTEERGGVLGESKGDVVQQS